MKDEHKILALIVVIVLVYMWWYHNKRAEGFKYEGGASGFIMNQSLSPQAAKADTSPVFAGELPSGDVRGLYGVPPRTLISTHPQAWRTTIYDTLPATTATVLS